MNLLARLMSHGFAISLVVLLAIGFIYRGELFPEWELPAFLVFDSDKDTSGALLTEKVEPAPMKDGSIGLEKATSGQPASEIKDDRVDTDAAQGKLPVKSLTEPGAAAITEGKSALVDVAEAVEKTGLGTSAATIIDTVEPPGAEAAPVNDVASAIQAGVTDKTTASATKAAGMTETITTIVDAGVKSEDVSDVVAVSKPRAAVATRETAQEPATQETAKAAVAPVIEGMDKTVSQVKTGPASEVETAVPGVVDSALSDVPVAEVKATVAAPTVASADSATSSYQVLALAREAYWMRDYQAAEDYYHQLILLDPDDPDGYGELANLYFSQGNWEEAASAYYEAGSRLVKSGLLEPARGLVDVIRGLKGPQADVLEDEIEAAQASSH